MARLGINITTNTSLAIVLVSKLLGISKSQLFRMAIFYSLISITENNKSISKINKRYIIELLILAISETSDKELNRKVKQELINILTQMQNSVSIDNKKT